MRNSKERRAQQRVGIQNANIVADSNRVAQPEPKHWVDKAIAWFAFLAMLGTGGAAWYARQQSITAQDMELQQLRAYIGPVANQYSICCPDCPLIKASVPDDPSPVCPQFPEYKNYIRIKIRNYGKTPGRTPLLCGSVQAFDIAEPIADRRDKIYMDCTFKNQALSVNPTIWPTEERLTYAAIPEPERWKEVISQKATAFYLGRIIYFDIFGKMHNSYICRRITGNGFLIGCGDTAGPQDD